MLLRRFAHQHIEVTLVADKPLTEVSSEIVRRIETNDQEMMLTELNLYQLDDLLDKAGSSFDCAIISKHGKSEESLRILKSLRCPVILVA